MSQELIDFLNQCLAFEPEKRPSAAALLNHVFLLKNFEEQPSAIIKKPQTLQFIGIPCSSIASTYQSENGGETM